MDKKFRIVTIFLFLTCNAMGIGIAFAEYPESNKTLNIIVGLAPGGTLDTQIRAISSHLSKHLGGARILVENIPGASGKIAYEKGFKAQPDGYTLLSYNLPGPIVTEMAEKAVRYKTSEFVPIYAISAVPCILVINAETPKTLDEFIQEGQKKVVTMGTMGSKSPIYLQAIAFVEATKIKANLIPFEGGAESLSLLAGKHIDAVFTTTLGSLPLVRAGKLKPLIVFSDQPDETYPGVLLSKDSKWDIATFPLIGAFVGPPKFSADKVKVLEEAFPKALKEPAFLEWAKDVKFDITPMNAAKVKEMTNKFYQDLDKFKSYLFK